MEMIITEVKVEELEGMVSSSSERGPRCYTFLFDCSLDFTMPVRKDNY